MFEDFELISVYTRQQAIEDGDLIDVSKAAQHVGFKVPTALTCALWEGIITLTKPVCQGELQDETKRLNILLFSLYCEIQSRKVGYPNAAAEADKSNLSEIYFNVRFSTEESNGKGIEVKAMIHPGDQQETVITIMLPNED